MAEQAVDTDVQSVDDTDELLAGLASLAKVVSGSCVAIVAASGGRTVASGLEASKPELDQFIALLTGRTVPDARLDPALSQHRFVSGEAGLRSFACLSLAGSHAGYLVIADTKPGPMVAASSALEQIAALAAATCQQATRHAALVGVTERAIRADRMLRMVAEAVSCADALTGLLGELCRHHGAPVGRIWKLVLPQGEMQEVSRFHEHHYYARPPAAPVHAGNSMTAQVIAANEPRTSIYSKIESRDRYVLLNAALDSGLRSQVSYPIWVQEERFGVSLAFSTERADLDEIVSDIASLANTIRPALFRKITEERIRHMALHDDLTQLGNRMVFNDVLERAVVSAARGEHALALLYLDLDGFKRVNDVRGHVVGDKLLAAVAGRLRSGVREGDTVARLGGDEFAVVQPCNGQPYAAMQLAQRLIQLIGEPFEIDGTPSTIGVSIGIALYPADGESPDELLRNADAALYDAKASGRNTTRLFDAGLTSIKEENDQLERDLKQAVETGAFRLAYQPVCELSSLRICGLEALLRWTHPTRGVIGPDVFVPLAEKTGLIVPLGHWVLETACADAVQWGGDVRLSVNLSPLQFRQPALAAQIADVLQRTGLPPDRLDLEVTEGLLLDDAGLVLQTMHELREQGVRMTLDDFGTAYASLSYLRRFPFDQIKIDMSFVTGMVEDDPTRAIVEAVFSLSERLQLDVVAEGVETEQQLELLRQMGCARVQGYLAGRPMEQERAQWLLGMARARSA